MKPNEPEFENELRALRPLAPSPALEEGIARQLATQRALVTVEKNAAVIPRRELDLEIARPGFFERIFPGLRWACAGAAAAVAIVFAIHRFDKPEASSSATSLAVAEADFEPESIARDIVTAEDQGIIYEDDAEPARLVRYTLVEHRVWTHPVTGARLEVEVPREDLVLVPVAMQ